MAVATHENFFARFQFHFEAVRLGQNLEVGKIILHQFVEADRLQIQRNLSGVSLGEQRQAVHDLREAAQFLKLAGGTLAFSRRKRLVSQNRFRFTAQNGQRRF